ncbi:hypothetical protein BDW74DRAFT_69294 [Aspergillus multicolor]|uniref:putative C6 transcription factor (War1) n=1 Tax=Aspergillus multicolor TaxID=41759 RepID=UPI003CCDCB6B
MEIDPRLHRGETSSESAESDSEYPEPPSQPLHQRLSSTALNPYNHAQSAQFAYTGDPSSAYRAHVSPQHDSDPNDPNSDAKRPRACESCRQLKVRCEPDLNPDNPCKRCAKAGRSCIVTVPSRKRQKKTDSRVSELERKIDVLTATLHATQKEKVDALLPSKNTGQTSSSSLSRGEENLGRRWLVPGQRNTDRSVSVPSRPGPSGNKRQHSGDFKDRDATATQSTPSQASNPSPATDNTDNSGRQWPVPWKGWSTSKPDPKENAVDPDIINRGLVSYAVAADSFKRYVDLMSTHVPMVVFPPGTQMDEVRKNKQVLFHAIVAVAMGPFDPGAQQTVFVEFYRTVAERVFVKGHKSLDLMQGILLSVAFYRPPENYDEINFFQLAQLAVSMGMDIQMYTKSKKKPFYLIREFAKQSAILYPDSAEVRRTWLACYFTLAQVSSALRRPILVRWLPYMDECVDILENSPDALPSDKKLVHWVKLGRIIEDISSRFFSDDAGSLSYSDPKSVFTIRAFEKQLNHWGREAISKYNSNLMTQAQAIVTIYLHENAMALDPFGDNELKNADITDPTAAERVTALSSTLSAIHEALDIIVAISPKDLINLPTFVLAKTTYSFVSLIKLYSIVTAPDSYIGQVIDPKMLYVECYMDKVIAHYTAAGSLAGGVTPGKFTTHMTMLRNMFKARNEQDRLSRAAPQAAKENTKDNTGQETNQANSQIRAKDNAPTPLHLLSEVATGESNQKQQQQYEPFKPRTNSDAGFPHNSPASNAATSSSQPGPSAPMSSQLLSHSPTAATSSNPNSNIPTTDPSSWSSYSQGQFYPTQAPPQFNPATTTPTQQSHPPNTGATLTPGYGFTNPNMPMTMGIPMDSSIPGTMSMGMGMGMYAPDLGVGLDDQFFNTLGLNLDFGNMGGDSGMPAWMPQGSWQM